MTEAPNDLHDLEMVSSNRINTLPNLCCKTLVVVAAVALRASFECVVFCASDDPGRYHNGDAPLVVVRLFDGFTRYFTAAMESEILFCQPALD